MRALRRDASGIRLDTQAPDPEPLPGEAVIRPSKVGVSSADVAIAEGRWPFAGILGHEFVGVVERVNSDKEEQRAMVGKRVVGSINIVCGKCDFCRAGLSTHCPTRTVLGLFNRDGCFAERFTLPIANLTLIPKSITDDAAVFAEPLSAAIHAARILRIEGKTYVTVLGDGPSGLLTAQVMTKLNASVRLLGKYPDKFTLCERWGIKHRHVSEVGRRQDQDIVVDCTGSASGLELAMQLVRPRGKIVLKTTPAAVPGASMTANGPGSGVDLSRAVCNELEIIGSRCGKISDAVNALANGEVEVQSMISRRFKLAEGVSAIKAAAEKSMVKVIIDV